MQSNLPKIDSEKLPQHIAIIMDGNGRWAQEKGEDRLYGHLNGVTSVREVVEAAAELGVKYLTLYAFSTENWDRPQFEVDGLMELLVTTIKNEVKSLHKNNIKLHVIGDLQMLPQSAQNELTDALAYTGNNTGLNLIMALSYSSRWEILEAVKDIAQQIKTGALQPENISHEVFQLAFNSSPYPDPQLLIRTGGEYRVSNFLLYQIAYTELYFTDLKWPDFRKPHFYEAIISYQNRQRRFGKTGGQVEQELP